MAFFKQPVSGSCCDDPCVRASPCDPCECTEDICCVDDRGAAEDYSGTYSINGTHEGTIAYERADGYSWFWRDWDAYPDDGWWVVSTVKGDYSDGVTQDETSAGGDACPYTPPWHLGAGGSVSSGAC